MLYLYFVFYRWDLLSKISLHHFCGFIWILHPLWKWMFQSKKPKSLRGVRHMCKFHLRTDVSCDTRFSRAWNKQLPRVIAERGIHHGPAMDGRSFWQNQWNFLWTCPLTKNVFWWFYFRGRSTFWYVIFPNSDMVTMPNCHIWILNNNLIIIIIIYLQKRRLQVVSVQNMSMM